MAQLNALRSDHALSQVDKLILLGVITGGNSCESKQNAKGPCQLLLNDGFVRLLNKIKALLPSG